MKLIIFNWKMNPETETKAKKLAKIVEASKKNSKFKVIICPPFIYLENLIKKFKKIEFGAQNCFFKEKGAFCGEISPIMLKNLGVKFVILGHSERRKYFKETDFEIGKKIKAALKNKLIPIFCVGENLKERKKGLTKEVLKKQLLNSLKEILKLKPKNLKLVIAYEPIWAIGTGNTCKVKDALEIIKFLKKTLINFLPKNSLSLFFIYGGSVDSRNIVEFLKEKEIDGVLIGSASLKEKEIISIFSNLKNEF